jgi:hypothetical protein
MSEGVGWGFSSLPVVRKMVLVRLRRDLKPRALTLAAWIWLLRFSVTALLVPWRQAARMPGRWALSVLPRRLKGSRRERLAQEIQDR